MHTPTSLQEQYAPESICFGCGPANQNGLQLKSFVKEKTVIAHWTPASYHHAFPNVLNGGIIGTLLDCHCNWTAAYHLMRDQGLPKTPCTVTAEYTIKLLRPTPMNTRLYLSATLDHIDQRERTTIVATLRADDKVCASCAGLFVAVSKTHPAYHRW